MPEQRPDTITRCLHCGNLFGARWVDRSPSQKAGWRTYQHADVYGEPYCPGGGVIQ